jgi:hypothetical protein
VLARRDAVCSLEYRNIGMQMIQQPDKITVLYSNDHEVCHVRMNQPHPEQVTPSWYGDSVGHYEGDTLVIDTVGVKTGPFAMVDMYGTPYSQALHVIVERYRLLDYQSAKATEERGQRELSRIPGSDQGFAPDLNYRGQGLQLEFTVEDEGVFTKTMVSGGQLSTPIEARWASGRRWCAPIPRAISSQEMMSGCRLPASPISELVLRLR